MASTTITDAVVFPQDEGTGVADGSESWDSAGYLGLIASHVGGSYKEGMGLSALDTTNETVDVAAGHCFISESGNQVQSNAASASTPDTTLPSGSDMVYLVVFPTSTTVSLDADTDAALDVVVDPTSGDTVTVEHNTTPTNPSLQIGTADSTGAGNGTSESNLGGTASITNIPIDEIFLGSSAGNEIEFDYTGGGQWNLNAVGAGGTHIGFKVNKTEFRANDGVDVISGDLRGRNGATVDSGGVKHSPQDVRNISSPSEGLTAYHDGSGTNTVGPAHYNGTNWISTVDGTTIS